MKQKGSFPWYDFTVSRNKGRGQINFANILKKLVCYINLTIAKPTTHRNKNFEEHLLLCGPV